MEAEVEWSKPNACVEVVFTPASKTRAVGPNQSVPVKAELRTKKEQTVIPANYSEALELPTDNNGKVSPKQAESKPGAPATFTYQAPPKRVKHSGFRLKDARSRAGIAHAEWELGESYVLEFRSVIVSTKNIDWAQSHASAVVRLEAQDDGKSEAEPKYSGQGNMTYQTGPLPNWNPCLHTLVRGQGTVPFRVYQALIHVEEQPSGTAASTGKLAKIELLYDIGMTQETGTGVETYFEGKGRVPGQPQFSPFWTLMYLSGREAETTGENMFILKDWTYVGQNGVVATKTLRSTCGGTCDEEISTFTLKEGDGSEASPPK